MIIYCIQNKINGKKYIGQTRYSLEARIRSHFRSANKGVDRKLYRAIRKYGKENFEYFILCECKDANEMNIKEAYYIGLYDTYVHGYNMTNGGPDNPMNHKELVDKHNAKMRSEDVRKRISKTLKDRIAKNGISQETRNKLSNSMRGNTNFAGHKRTQYAIEKTNESHYKPIYCLNADFELVREFKCLRDAATWVCELQNSPNYTGKCRRLKQSNDLRRFYNGLLWIYGVPCVETIETIKTEYPRKGVE